MSPMRRRCSPLAIVFLVLAAVSPLAIALGASAEPPAGPGGAPQDAPPAIFVHHRQPSPEALRPSESAPGVVDLRLSKLSIALAPKGGSLKSQAPDWLRYRGVRRPLFSPTSLQVLFCTWQA